MYVTPLLVKCSWIGSDWLFPGPDRRHRRRWVVKRYGNGSRNWVNAPLFSSSYTVLLLIPYSHSREIYFKETLHPLAAILFLMGAITLAYSLAVIARNVGFINKVFTGTVAYTKIFLAVSHLWTGVSVVRILYQTQGKYNRLTFIYPSPHRRPQALMQTQLFRTLHHSTDESTFVAKKQIKIFFIVATFMYCWTFLPEYIFPFLSSLAIICWFAPNNKVASFVGSGLGGMGVLNFTLSWSNITSDVTLSPWWTQVIKFVAYVISVYILVPISHFKGYWWVVDVADSNGWCDDVHMLYRNNPNIPIMSQSCK